jgi:hypothetical protein
MDTLTSAPFNLLQDEPVAARILAANIVGESQYSMENALGAKIIVAPHTPILAPYRGGMTSVDRAHVVIAPLTGAQTGGSPITSYYIQFDGLTNGVDWLELQGFTTYTTSLTFLKDGLETNKIYQFRYKARTIFGWSDWSPVGLIKTIRIPDQLAPVVTSLQGDNVLIEWIQPYLGGDTLLVEYNITIRGKDDRMYNQLTYCSGQDSLVKMNNECYIPMSTFWASPFNLVQDDLIQIKVAARN